MAWGKTNVSSVRASLIVHSGAVTSISLLAADGSTISPIATEDGFCFPKLRSGAYTVTILKNGKTIQIPVEIPRNGVVNLPVIYPVQPCDFSFTGNYLVVDDNNNQIPMEQWPSVTDWNIRVLESQNITCMETGDIDVWAIGGGSGIDEDGNSLNPYYGKCGNIANGTAKISAGEINYVSIGAGGKPGRAGGATSGFEINASGGRAVAIGNNDAGATTVYRGFRYGGRHIENGIWKANGLPNTGQAGSGNYINSGTGGSGCLVISNHRTQ